MASFPRPLVFLLFAFFVLFQFSCSQDKNPSGIDTQAQENSPRAALDQGGIATKTYPIDQSSILSIPFQESQYLRNELLSVSPAQGVEIMFEDFPLGSTSDWFCYLSRGGNHQNIFNCVIESFPFDGSWVLHNETWALLAGFGDFGWRKIYKKFPANMNRYKSYFSFDAGYDVTSNGISESLNYIYFFRNSGYLDQRICGYDTRPLGTPSYPPGKYIKMPNHYAGQMGFNLGFLSEDPDEVWFNVYSRVDGIPGKAITRLDNIKVLAVPWLQILDPVNGNQFEAGEEITLRGWADAAYMPTNIEWRRDPGSVLIAQNTLEPPAVTDLPVGTHTITLSGRTPSGRMVTDSIQVGIRQTIRIEVNLNPRETRPGAAQFDRWLPNPGLTMVRIRVTSGGLPRPNYGIRMSSWGTPNSGGHRGTDHNLNQRPSGLFFENGVGHQTLDRLTLADGEFSVEYRPSQFGGIEIIHASSTVNTNLGASATLTVRIPDLQPLPEHTNYLKIGGTRCHHGPNDNNIPWINDDNHYGTNDLIITIELMADDHVLMYPNEQRLAFNDMSLESGGKFDINGQWLTYHADRVRAGNPLGENAHLDHRIGNNVDLRARDIDPENPERHHMTEEVRMWVRRDWDLYFGAILEESDSTPNWHFHLTVNPIP